MRWRDVDFVDGLFRVEEQLPPLKKAEVPYTVRTKSKRGVREMPFLPMVAESLAAHLEAELAAGRGQDDDFVFCTRNRAWKRGVCCECKVTLSASASDSARQSLVITGSSVPIRASGFSSRHFLHNAVSSCLCRHQCTP